MTDTKKIVEVEGMDELQARLSAFPGVYEKVEQKTLIAAVLTLHENVPPYPPQPIGAKYRRTGTLGRTLGSSAMGGAGGTPDVLEIRVGSGGSQARFGTRLKYAPHVIGWRATQQAEYFKQYWWSMDKILGKSVGKIRRLFQIMAEELAAFLEGRGL